ncbi:terminase [bacterium]|nr:terminase [Candidatus Elulimicrobium humile]
MSIIDDKLSEVFNSEKIKVSETAEPFTNLEVISPKEVANDKENTIANDFNTSRANLHNLLIKGEEALKHSLEIAKQSEHPRAFEVVGNMIKQLADVNQQLLDLHKQQADVGRVQKQESKTVNNNVFIGSTNELNKIIKNYKETEGE